MDRVFHQIFFTMQVQITKNEEGKKVISSTNNPEYGYVRVESESTSFQNGWIRKDKRSALIRGKVADLKVLEGMTNLPGQIVIKESTSPTWEGHKPKINPSTGVVVKHKGSPVYREYVFTQNMEETDVFLSSDVAEIKNTRPKVVQLTNDNLDMDVPF